MEFQIYYRAFYGIAYLLQYIAIGHQIYFSACIWCAQHISIGLQIYTGTSPWTSDLLQYISHGFLVNTYAFLRIFRYSVTRFCGVSDLPQAFCWATNLHQCISVGLQIYLIVLLWSIRYVIMNIYGALATLSTCHIFTQWWQ